MNSFIETLNHRGENFLSFAWPMFWQAGLLIVVLAGLDLLFRRRLRASIRYALWLVVLVKLCAPPTLALPTSPAWWLHKTPPPAAMKPATHYTVTYDDTPLPELPQTPLPALVAPPPAMDFAAWSLVVSFAVSSALLLWLLVRWWQIAREVRRAKTSERLAALAGEAGQIAGMKYQVPVKLTTNSMSPAVCGLFRPAILIPQTLAENFSDEQLRAVLLHELIHLRRRDVWLNFLQAWLQIFYWWHPLVWLANARIRHVREEAVDDAVMLALRDGAEAYAPTLLEVAKLALNRPLASLGLVGILESRHSLRQRIERLVDFRPPRRAGLTLVSLFGILTFTAVAVPMGGAPAPAEKETVTALAVSTPPAAVQNTNPPSVLITSQIYQIRAVDFEKFASGLEFKAIGASGDSTWPVAPEKYRQLVASLETSGLQPVTRPRIQTSSGMPASMYVGDGTNSIEIDCTPYLVGASVVVTIHGEVVDATGNETVTNQFSAKTAVENQGGIVIRMEKLDGFAESNLLVVTGVQLVTNSPTSRYQQQTVPITEPPGEVDKIVQAAKLNYEMGKLDEAAVEFIKALAADPDNADAKYYLGLIVRQRNGQPGKSPVGREDIIEKLRSIRLDQVAFAATPLSDVLRHLSQQARSNDPEERGINFLIDPNLAGSANPGGFAPDGSAQTNRTVASLITIDPPLTNAQLGSVLDAVVRGASEPIYYSVQDFAIVFRPGKPPQPLENKFAPRTSINALPTSPVPQADTAIPGQKLITFRVDPRIGLEKLKNELLAAGVKMPPTIFFYNTNNGTFFMRGSEEQLALGNRVVLKLNGRSTNEIEAASRNFTQAESALPTSDETATNLFARTFRVDKRAFYDGLLHGSSLQQAGLQTNTVSAMARSFFSTLGVDILQPAGKSIFFNDGLGLLYVKATKSDLDTIERAIEVLNQAPPQVHIKARFYEVPKGTLAGLEKNFALTNESDGKLFGILTGGNAKTVMHDLQGQVGFEILAEPEVTTISGRQTQMRATTMITVVTNLAFQKNGTNGSIVPQTETVETGPILDTVPYVLADGYTINLFAMASVTDFLGYAPSPNSAAANNDLSKVDLPQISPQFRVQQAMASVNLWDNQTVVLGKLENRSMVGKWMADTKPKVQDKEVLVFITATIVDPTGNRVHSGDDLPFAKDGVPPQPDTK
jgi:beta-lactamase regulating signal transducer with metallopeptidase domain